MALINTVDLATKPFDTVILHNDYPVYLIGRTVQRDGSCLVQLEYADAGAGRYEVHVELADLHEPMWDYDENDC